MKLLKKLFKKREIKSVASDANNTKNEYQTTLNEVGREQFVSLVKKGLSLPVALF